MRGLILSSVVGSGLIASVAAADVETIDEARFVAVLEATDPRIARLAAEGTVARARIVAAGVRPNPSLAIDREVPYVDGNGFPTNYVRLVVPIDISGRRGLAIDAAETSVRAQAIDAAGETFAIVIDGLRTFQEAAYARLQVELLVGERASLVRAAEIVRQRGKAGEIAGYDVQRIDLELAAFDDQIASAQVELARSRRQLAGLVGRVELDAASSLTLPASVPALDSLLADAVTRRPDHRAARLRVEASQGRIRAASRGWVPLPSFTAGAMTADLGDRTGTGYVAGLSLTLPIFDHGQADRAAAVADRKIAEADARWIEMQVPARVRTAHAVLAARIDQATRLAASQTDRLDAMLRSAETAFREGNGTVIELVDAHRTARDVRRRALELRRDVALARLDLELALGRRLGGAP